LNDNDRKSGKREVKCLPLVLTTALTVDVAAVTHFDYHNDENVITNFIDHAIIARADTIFALATSKFLRAVRSWIIRQASIERLSTTLTFTGNLSSCLFAAGVKIILYAMHAAYKPRFALTVSQGI
jgi:putative effector of murein hydrolase